VDDRRKRKDLIVRVDQNGVPLRPAEGPGVLDPLRMPGDDLGQAHRLVEPERGEPDLGGIGHFIPDRKGDLRETIKADRDGLALPAEGIGELLLRLDQLRQDLLRHRDPLHRAGGEVRPDRTELFGNHHLLVAAGLRFEKRVVDLFRLRQMDLPDDSFGRPEVGPVAVVELHLGGIFLREKLLHLSLDQLQKRFQRRLIYFLAPEERFKVADFDFNRRHAAIILCRAGVAKGGGSSLHSPRTGKEDARYSTPDVKICFSRIKPRSDEKRSRMSEIPSATIAIRSSPSPQAITGTLTPSGPVTSGRKS